MSNTMTKKEQETALGLSFHFISVSKSSVEDEDISKHGYLSNTVMDSPERFLSGEDVWDAEFLHAYLRHREAQR